jgi:hypothetical protein
MHIYGVYTAFGAGKSPNTRSYTMYIYGSGQPYIYLYSIKSVSLQPHSTSMALLVAASVVFICARKMFYLYKANVLSGLFLYKDFVLSVQGECFQWSLFIQGKCFHWSLRGKCVICTRHMFYLYKANAFNGLYLYKAYASSL